MIPSIAEAALTMSQSIELSIVAIPEVGGRTGIGQYSLKMR